MTDDLFKVIVPGPGVFTGVDLAVSGCDATSLVCTYGGEGHEIVHLPKDWRVDCSEPTTVWHDKIGTIIFCRAGDDYRFSNGSIHALETGWYWRPVDPLHGVLFGPKPRFADVLAELHERGYGQELPATGVYSPPLPK